MGMRRTVIVRVRWGFRSGGRGGRIVTRRPRTGMVMREWGLGRSGGRVDDDVKGCYMMDMRATFTFGKGKDSRVAHCNSYWGRDEAGDN